MPLEYDNSEPAIRKVGNDEYELIWKVSDLTLCVSTLTEQQILDLIEALQRMTRLPLPAGKRSLDLYYYYFTPMRHRVTG